MMLEEYMDYSVCVKENPTREMGALLGATSLPIVTANGVKILDLVNVRGLSTSSEGNMCGKKAKIINILEAYGYKPRSSPFPNTSNEMWFSLRVPRSFVQANISLV